MCDSKTNTANINPEHHVDLALLGILCKEEGKDLQYSNAKISVKVGSIL